MFTSTSTMQVMAAIVDSGCENGVRLSAAPVNSASPDLRQILSPRLTNTQNMDICSPTPGYSSLDPNQEIARLKREILAAHENALKQKKAADKSRRELQRKEKELYDAQAQVMYLGQQSRGYEAELTVVRDQLAGSRIDVDVEAVKIERDMYQEQEKTALAERDESRQKERAALKRLAAERKARTKAEKQCHAAVQQRIVTTTRRENFKGALDAVRRDRDNIMERLYASEQNLKRHDSENSLLRKQLIYLEGVLRKPAEVFRQKYDAAVAFFQREHKTTLARVQQEHQNALARVHQEHSRALATARQTRDQERTILDAATARLAAAESSNEELRARLSIAESSCRELQMRLSTAEFSHGELQQRLDNAEDTVFRLASSKADAEAKLRDALNHIWSIGEPLPSESTLQTSPTYYEDLASLAGPPTGVGLGFSHLA